MAKKLISYDDEATGLGLPDVVEQRLDVRYSGQGSVVTTASPAVPAGFVPLRARLPLASSDPVVIVFAGSSTTQGGGVGRENSFPRLIAGDHAYIQDDKAENIPTPFNSGVTVVNMAMGGAVRFSYISEYEVPIVAGWEPALVFHSIGSSDSQWEMDPDDLAAVIGDRIDAIDAAASLPVGHVVVHQHTRNDGSHVTPWDSFLPGLYGLESTRDNVTVIDLSAAFKAVGVPGDDPLGLLQDDNFHVNIKGQKLYADLLSPLFALPEPDPTSEPVSELVLFDDFERPDGPLAGTSPTEGEQIWEDALGTWSIKEGKATPDITRATTVIDAGVRDLDLTYDYIKGTSDITSVLFSDGTAENMYTFVITDEYYTIRRYVDGSHTVVKSAGPGAAVGQTHKMKVSIRGTEATYYLNGQELYTLTVEEHESLRTHHGFRGNLGDSSIDNLRITTPEQAW